MPARRHFGSVRRLPSGRYQASYWHLAERHTADATFETKAEARTWLSEVETEIRRGRWIDPSAGRVFFGQYVDDWLDHRYDIRPRTRELYRSLIKRHLKPTFERVPLTDITDITTATVRRWHASIAKQQPTTAAKAYRLLRAVLMTATADGLIVANPCVIKGAGHERAPERRIPSLETVHAIADAIGGRYRALVYTAALAGLRAGSCPESNAATSTWSTGRSLSNSRPRSSWARAGDKGAPITTQHWSKKFRAAADSAGAEGLHFHDLRHLAGTLAATTGASTRELMARLGHSTPRASLIYQHATEQRDRQIAAGIDAILEAAGQADRDAGASVYDIESSRRSANQA